MNTDELESLAAKVLAGAASRDEQEKFEAILAAEPERRQEFREIQRLESLLKRAAQTLPASNESPAPPDLIRQAFLEAVRAKRTRTLSSAAGAPAWKERVARWFQTLPRPAFLLACTAVSLFLGVFLGLFFATWRSPSLRIAVQDPRVLGIDHDGRLVLRNDNAVDPALVSSVQDGILLGLAEAYGSGSLRKRLQVIPLAPTVEATLSQGSPETLGPVLVSPVDTAVRQPIVEFRWLPVPGALEYQLVVESPGGSNPERRTSTTPALRWPTPFEPGILYRWRVEARTTGDLHASETSTFRALNQDNLSRLTSLEGQYSGSPAVLAGLYLQFGLREEAILQALRLHGLNDTRSRAPNNMSTPP
jgi:hypothetical protein